MQTISHIKITYADCADYQSLTVNKSTQAKSLLHSREQETESIGLFENTNKIEFFLVFLKKNELSPF